MGLNYGLFVWLGWAWVNFDPLLGDLNGKGYDIKVDRTVYVGGYGYVSPDPFLYALDIGVFGGARGAGNGYNLALNHAVIRATVGYRYFRWRMRERNFNVYPFVGAGYGRVWVSFSRSGDLSYGDFVSDPGTGGTMYTNTYIGTVGIGAMFDFGFTVGLSVGYDVPVIREVWVRDSDRLSGGPDLAPYGFHARFMIGYARDWNE